MIINRKNASPCLLLTVKSLSSLSYDVVQEEIVSKVIPILGLFLSH